MEKNATPSTATVSFGLPLSDCTDADQLKRIAERLWSLLDDIDTASDMFKPRDEASYRRFYEYAMRKTTERGKELESDGFRLFLPKDSTQSPPEEKTTPHA